MQTGGYDPAYPMNPGMSPMAMPFQGGMGGMMPMGMPPGNPMPIPPMSMPNYNPGGGTMPTPLGGQWNQIAQQMAGPMFMPQGSTILGGAPNAIPPMQVSPTTVPGYKPPTSVPPPMVMPTGTPPVRFPGTLGGHSLGAYAGALGGGGFSGGINGARPTFRF
jgi:hypothetical protein